MPVLTTEEKITEIKEKASEDKGKKRTILGHMFRYASAQYFSQFVGFFTAIFMRMFLGPFYMGVWSLVGVVVDYASYTHLGTTSTLYYKIPFCKGSGETEEGDTVKNVVFTYIMLTAFIGGIGIASYALLFRQKLSPEIFWGLIVASVLLSFRRIYTFYVALLRANKDFKVLSRSIIFDAILNLILVLTLVKFFQLKGLFIAVILMPIINVLFIRHFVNYGVKIRFNLNKLVSYIKFGFPLFVNGILALLLRSVDKIMIAKFLGLEALGIYSIALLARNYSTGMSKNFIAVITPHFLEDYGKKQDMATAERYLKIPAELLSCFMVALLSLIYIVAPVFVEFVLPKFAGGITALKILLLATFFYAASPQTENFIVVLNKQKFLVPITFSAIIVNAILNFVLIKMGYGINGVAFATVVSSFIAFFVTFTYALLHIENFISVLRFILKLIAPLVYAVCALLMIDRVIAVENIFIEVVLKSVVFMALFSPWIYMVNKKTAILSMIKNMIIEKLRNTKRINGT